MARIEKKVRKNLNAKLADQALGTVHQFLDHIGSSKCTGFSDTCETCDKAIKRMGALREAFQLVGELE